MKLQDLIAAKKKDILARWFDEVLATYPQDTAKFFKSQKNRFANPAGTAITESLQGILEELAGDGEVSQCHPFLDNIVRVRAIQDFPPSTALAFVFSLRKILREMLRPDACRHGLEDEYGELESRIDELALSSFDAYMKCREQVYDMKNREWKNRMFRLLQKAGLLEELQE
jgi:hypothetical protein